ncbi:MAG TPA: AAA family ATPase [Pseudolabrys sp.]|nr:AAA family ATPase [Pseudolabrys sp.]
MRLKSLALKNFRCFPDEIIEFDSYTALVGANNAGKSAIVAALDIFFRSSAKSAPITVDDFYRGEINREIRIELKFDGLGEAESDEFSHYISSGELTFFIKAYVESGSVRTSIHGIRRANPKFSAFFEKTTAAEKKEFYEKLPKEYLLPKWQSQAQAAEALRNFENAKENLKFNEPIPSDDKAFGAEGPVTRLRQFIDFVYIPAVKDAGDEAIEARNTAFSRLIERAVRAKLKIEERIAAIRGSAEAEIGAIAKDHKEVLSSLATKIEAQYRKFNSSESQLHLEWGDFDANNLQLNLPPVHLQISDDLIRNKIGKFGHGTQRNYLLALLMVSASYDFTEQQAIIIACEEPELYQHPPQARILASAFFAMASNKTQIIATTHSPYFVAAKSFGNVRLIRRTRGERSRAYSWSIDENRALISKAKGEEAIGQHAALAAMNQFLQPQINEMFFAPYVIFVEGEEDRAIIEKYLSLAGLSGALLAVGAHFVPTNGKGNMMNALSLARGLEIPYFAVFDADMNLNDPNNVALNKNIFAVMGYEGVGHDGVVADTVLGPNLCVWKECLQTSICAEVGGWEGQKAVVCGEFGWTIDRLRKNPMVLEATLDAVFKEGKIAALENLCSALVAKTATVPAVKIL